MKVVTYFDQLPDPSFNEHRELVELVRSDWRSMGWEDYEVIGKGWATAHPRYDEVLSHIRTLPTVNNRDYEDACYLRYLALEQFCKEHGPVLFLDSDVVNNGAGQQLFKWPMEMVSHTGMVYLNSIACAFACVIDSNGASKVVDAIMKASGGLDEINGRPHTSDMYITRSMGFPSFPLCVDADDPAWGYSPLIHCSTRSTNRLSQIAGARIDRISWVKAMIALSPRRNPFRLVRQSS